MMPGPLGRVDVVLVAGGTWHDFDFARLRLLDELAAHDVARTRVFEDFACTDALATADVLVTYTCNVRPTPAQQDALHDFVSRGGRWVALHGTNAAIDPQPEGAAHRYRTPDVFGRAAQVLGSRFLGHPPIAPYTVHVREPGHPLVAGLSDFEVKDELYVSDLHGPLEVLLGTTFDGECPSFGDAADAPDPDRPVMYLKRTGDGTTAFLTLGHCRGRLDVQDLGIDDWGRVDRWAWEVPEFLELVTRLTAWGVHGDAWTGCGTRHQRETCA